MTHTNNDITLNVHSMSQWCLRKMPVSVMPIRSFLGGVGVFNGVSILLFFPSYLYSMVSPYYLCSGEGNVSVMDLKGVSVLFE